MKNPLPAGRWRIREAPSRKAVPCGSNADAQGGGIIFSLSGASPTGEGEKTVAVLAQTWPLNQQ